MLTLLVTGGLAVLANPDFLVLGMFLAVLALVVPLGGLMGVRACKRVFWPGVLLGCVVALPATVLWAEVIAHRGERTRSGGHLRPQGEGP
ncbi:hypothetical protein ACIRST_37905 [Kitasatospora sp. NPDC101447]|uniref:hypothetical protein n=1 Tax=Kitasatospora sp. NPDC101447 TaxID=3364102 RepID=UPI00380CBE08